MVLRLITLCAVLSLPTFGNEVLRVHKTRPLVIISQTPEPFEKKDFVCVSQKDRDISCGEVIIAKEKYAVFHITQQRQDVIKNTAKRKKDYEIVLTFEYPAPLKGDPVRLVNKDPTGEIRKLASDLSQENRFGGDIISEKRQRELDSAIEKLEASKPFNPVSVISAGMNFVFPMMQYQQAITPKWGLGVMPTYMNYNVSDGSLKGFGGFLTYNRYGNGPFTGLWWQISLGMYNLRATYGSNTGTLFAPAALSTVGYRITWKNILNFGLALGGQYVLAGSNPASTGLTFNGFVPSILFDAGVIF